MKEIAVGSQYRFLITLMDFCQEYTKEVDLLTDDSSPLAIQKVIRSHFPPCWQIQACKLIWEDCF
jgi:hypothetical protein